MILPPIPSRVSNIYLFYQICNVFLTIALIYFFDKDRLVYFMQIFIPTTPKVKWIFRNNFPQETRGSAMFGMSLRIRR
jgi:hypothetical protein